MRPSQAIRLQYKEFIDYLITTGSKKLNGQAVALNDLPKLLLNQATITEIFPTAALAQRFIETHLDAAARWWSEHDPASDGFNPFSDQIELVNQMLEWDLGVRLQDSSWVTQRFDQEIVLDSQIASELLADLGIDHNRYTYEPRARRNVQDELDKGKIVFERDGDDFVIHGTHLIEGDVVTVTSSDGKEYETTVGEVTVLEDETMISAVNFNNTAQRQKLDNAIDDGAVMFMNTPEGYVLRGKNLETGSLVEATQANGNRQYVVVGDQLNYLNDGTMSANFTPAPRFALDTTDGHRFYISGKGLETGQELTVPTKNGTMRRVRIESIVDDNNGWQKASYTPLDKPKRTRTISR